MYRALGPTPMRVAELVAAHPTEPAFLMPRVDGASRFAQIADPADQLAVAQQFMEQLAALHRLDPEALDLPELGTPGSVREHVLDEIVEWETQYATAGGGVPVITLAFAWLREHLPDDGDWPVVLVQGDTGPGNFMYSGADLVAITDWELAHWGDLHDDLAWILVRDTLERFPDLAHGCATTSASGFRIDPERLGYFRVLAQLRATIGTLAGLRSHDARAEIAWQLIYNTLHTRVLGESLAAMAGVPCPRRSPTTTPAARWRGCTTSHSATCVTWSYRRSDDPFAATRAKGLARLLKYLRAVEAGVPRSPTPSAPSSATCSASRSTDSTRAGAAVRRDRRGHSPPSGCSPTASPRPPRHRAHALGDGRARRPPRHPCRPTPGGSHDGTTDVNSPTSGASSPPTTSSTRPSRTTRGGPRRSGSRGRSPSATCSATSIPRSGRTWASSSAGCWWSTTPRSCRGSCRSTTGAGTNR